KGFVVIIHYLGGETADVGDVVRTVAVNGTMTARWPKEKLVTNDNIQPGDVIVGLSSSGQATYETEYNSGIGSNGLTSARHDVLDHSYFDLYPETFDTEMKVSLAYTGRKSVSDLFSESPNSENTSLNIGRLLLSPTR